MRRTPGSRHPAARSALLVFILLAFCPSFFALNPALDLSQYAHTSWKNSDGFAKGRITAMAQTSDGYLWLGTEFGLLRFDGVRNVPFQPLGDEHLPSNTIFSLLSARDGTLWIGTDKGLASWKEGKLTHYPEVAGNWIFGLIEGRDGVVWVGTSSPSTGKLCAIHNDNARCYGEDGSLGKGVFDLYEDSRGNLWAVGKDGLWRWKPGPPQFLAIAGASTGDQCLSEDLDGALLIIVNGEVKRLVNGKTETYPLPVSADRFRAKSLFRDRDGSLWIGSMANGLMHVHQGMTDLFSSANGSSGDDVHGLFEDREGNIWVSTLNGLDHFRDLAVSAFSRSQRLSTPFVGSVLARRDGTVLFAASNGLYQWSQGQIATYGTITQDQSRAPLSIYEDQKGRIWAVTRREFGYLENRKFVPLKGIPGGVVRSIAEDTGGNLWIANQDFGLLQLRDNRIVQQLPWAKLGHQDFAGALAFDPLQGGLWIGFFQGGLVYFRDGKVQASYGVADGLGEGRVTDLQLDNEGTLWAATAGGLSRLKNNRIVTLTSANGLPCNPVHWLIHDDEHFVWLNATCGLVRIAQGDLVGWANSREQNRDLHERISTTVFDSTDGVKSQAYLSGYYPSVGKSTDGRLWFAAYDSASVVDPRRLPFNKLPPPVHIEEITADRKTYEVTAQNNGSIRLPALSRDLQIDYTALSLVAPGKIRFRYKLEGYDKDWQDAGNRRQAFYTNLPPRNYRFRVIACNNSGVWNETGTFLDFTIAPAYYQTAWFRVLFVIAVLLVLYALYQLRVRQVAQQVRAGMEGRLDERERIARDLHDTLLQSVQGLILKVHAVSKKMTSDVAAREALEKTLDHADQVLAEGRDRVRNLRATATSLDDLPAAFTGVAEEAPQGHKATFKTVVEGSTRKLHPLVQEEAYCIGREAIINALTHSGGRNVEVEIIYESRQFRLRIRDDGHGIDHKILEEGGRSDHWGMQGMRERANKIGAELKLWSGRETGTEVELTVPAATAYQAAGNNSRLSRLPRIFRRNS